jgi:hypothetical protein
MIDIRDIQEGILIEARDFRIPVGEVYNEVMARGKGMSNEDCLNFTSNIIGLMVIEGLVKLIKTKSRKVDSDDDDLITCYEFESESGLTPEETKLILKEPGRWEEMNVFSLSEAYMLAITKKGRKELKRIRMQ